MAFDNGQWSPQTTGNPFLMATEVIFRGGVISVLEQVKTSHAPRRRDLLADQLAPFRTNSG